VADNRNTSLYPASGADHEFPIIISLTLFSYISYDALRLPACDETASFHFAASDHNSPRCEPHRTKSMTEGVINQAFGLIPNQNALRLKEKQVAATTPAPVIVFSHLIP
jgi:hypothetical protein